MVQTGPQKLPVSSADWWRERELIVVLLLGAVTYCIRLDAIPLFGEEPRRAQIAREMVETGDWLVPGTQRVFLPSRPPLQNWLIAAASLPTGTFNIWTVRLPSILSTLILAILIYGYLRQQFSKLGSVAGAASFVTMTLVMEFGRSAETEAVFSLFVAASLLLWHWGWMKKWSPWKMWSVGYSCAALGLLTKGLQAPLYFVGATMLFLFATGNWRAIFTRAHIVGIISFGLVFGAWQVPFTLQRGIEDSWSIYFSDVAGRFVDRSWSVFLGHLVLYPCELFFVRMLPWSMLLLAYFSPKVRRMSAPQREVVFYLTICIGFSFLSVWLPPGSKARYYMPLFPCFAALIGIVVERLISLRSEASWTEPWSVFVRAMTYTMLGSAGLVIADSVIASGSMFSLSIPAAIGFAVCVCVTALMAHRSQFEMNTGGSAQGIFSVAAYLAMIQLFLVLNVQQQRCEDIAGQIADLQHQLPVDSQLVSLGPVHHAFAFFYKKPIPIIELDDQHNLDQVDYFCLHTYDCEPEELPFEWTPIAVVRCDRFKNQNTAKDRVFVGRRTMIQQAGHASDIH